MTLARGNARCARFLSLLLLLAAARSACAARFAVIGDFGSNSAGEGAVADMVKAWHTQSPLDGIFTLGDNNYYSGLITEAIANVDKYYGWAIYSTLAGHVGITDVTKNIFWPALGNHDYGGGGGTDCAVAGNIDGFKNYFEAVPPEFLKTNILPANTGNFYEKKVGDVHWFVLDSDCHEPLGYPNGHTKTSPQQTWLATNAPLSNKPWRIATMHHSPFSSSLRQQIASAQWDYEEMGIDVVMSGHDHTYERLLNPRQKSGRDNYPYFVNGIGGAGLYKFLTLQPGSTVRYNGTHSAQLLTTTSVALPNGDLQFDLKIQMMANNGLEVDCYQLTKVQAANAGGAFGPTTYKECIAGYSALSGKAPTIGKQNARWRYLNGGTGAAPAGWNGATFNDASWKAGASPLGFGGFSWDGGWGTTLDSNAAQGGAYYFRLRICLTADQLAKIKAATSVQLRVLANNGADVYVNGQPALSNAAADAPAFYYNNVVSLDPNLLVAGPNIIAAKVTNTANSGDTAFDLDIVYVTADGKPVSAASLLCDVPLNTYSVFNNGEASQSQGPGATWRYLAAPRRSPASTGSNAWHALTFKDKRWKSGKGPVGRGEGVSWASTLPSKNLRASGGTPYYFRTLLCLSADSAARLNTLNGSSITLLARGGKPATTVYINSVPVYASPSLDPAASGYWDASASFGGGGLFRPGANVIGVMLEVQSGATSIGMDLNLLYGDTAPLSAAPTDCPAVTSKAYSLFTHLEVAPNRGFSRSPANKAGPGIVWSYFDGGATDLPAASGDDASWAGAKFADADKWAKGAAPLGRGEGVAWATTIPAGAAPGGTTYLYFRTTLCLTQGILDQLPSTDLTLRILSDDGVRVFINTASEYDDITVKRKPKYWNIKKTVRGTDSTLSLKSGRNVIAVQVASLPDSAGTGMDFDIVYSGGSPFASGALTC